ncbi:GMC oxidoreductase [Metarhizium album ARSEF 1941]|uniref:GMC oxidoreductase n=1 Tax=Metarhizium album (strain ARSEF 1941) TaxID=1081103 RepID=A0A0B2WWN9_METAS|nr:GMC oxidoreductase [Metarhizium album ARSEF 1941]KHN97260.1 GMC oxidoreductase [Metarhizium album ARSEF 1941]
MHALKLESTILAAVAVSLACAADSGTSSFDYIVVGAGTAGNVVANRLSQDPKISVAVIDPGADWRGNPNVTNPMAWLDNIGSLTDWAYPTVPQVNASNRVIAFAAGKGIGGSSLINGMAYIRGDKAQFDAWGRLGNPGWNWDTMLRYYKKVEKIFPPTPAQMRVGASIEPQYHGTSGELHVAFGPMLENGTLHDTLRSSWAVMEEGVNQDLNSGTTKGFSVWPQTLDPEENKRWDSATAFYWPIQSRRNLKHLNGTVSKLLWKTTNGPSGAEVAGVEYFDPDGRRRTAKARKEVIISAGALRTPLILERSGIGNPRLLNQKGVKVVVDLPAVGENLMDQPLSSLFYNTSANIKGYTSYATFVTAADIYGTNVDKVAKDTKAKLGQWARQLAQSSLGGLNASALEHIFEIQHEVIFEKHATLAEIISGTLGGKIGSTYWDLMPFGRGSVHMSSVDNLNAPVIDPMYFSLDFDLATQVETGKIAAEFWTTSPAQTVITGQFAPDATVLPPRATDEQWKKYVQDSSSSVSHMIGTAPMMARELGGVVDPELKVYGTKNVRVVDASVLPMQFSGHPTATIYAVADRASDVILGRLN